MAIFLSKSGVQEVACRLSLREIWLGFFCSYQLDNGEGGLGPNWHNGEGLGYYLALCWKYCNNKLLNCWVYNKRPRVVFAHILLGLDNGEGLGYLACYGSLRV